MYGATKPIDSNNEEIKLKTINNLKRSTKGDQQLGSQPMCLLHDPI